MAARVARRTTDDRARLECALIHSEWIRYTCLGDYKGRADADDCDGEEDGDGRRHLDVRERIPFFRRVTEE